MLIQSTDFWVLIARYTFLSLRRRATWKTYNIFTVFSQFVGGYIRLKPIIPPESCSIIYLSSQRWQSPNAFLLFASGTHASNCHVVKASDRPGDAVVEQWQSLTHYHSHHGVDKCNHLPTHLSPPVSVSQALGLLFSSIFISLLRSHPQPSLALSLGCRSSVAAINNQFISDGNKCKSGISGSTLTPNVCRRPVWFLSRASLSRPARIDPPRFRSHQTWAVAEGEPEDDSSNRSPPFVARFARDPACLPEPRDGARFDLKRGWSKRGVHPWVVRLLLQSSKHSGWTK